MLIIVTFTRAVCKRDHRNDYGPFPKKVWMSQFQREFGMSTKVNTISIKQNNYLTTFGKRT